MVERIDFLLYKSRFIVVGLLIIAIAFVILGVLFAGLRTTSAQSLDANTSSSFLDSPNVVSAGLATATNTLATGSDTIIQTANAGFRSFASVAARSARTVGHGALLGTMIVGHGIGAATTFIVRIPVAVFTSAAKIRFVSAVIKPVDHNPVPIIDPNSSALAAARKALPAAPAGAQPVAGATAVIWPLHGMITTQFGVPELPYQAIHTGLDISDGKAAGITPVKAYRAGRVIAVEHTGGLGNHVIIDHGSGVTSVYGHLASIAVSVGQQVVAGTTLGFEGSTGVSTGPHLHFEIRVNGQAADPHQFIAGQP